MNKSHKNCISYHKSELEKNYNYKCRKEYPIPRDNLIRQIDVACFRNECPNAIGIEAESNENFNSPQIQSNKQDLMEFKRLFGKDKTKVFHISVNDTIDFNRKLVCDVPKEKIIPPKKANTQIIKKSDTYKIPKKKINLNW